jgi:hypothetical protein
LLLVSLARSMPDDPVIWQAVGDLLAELIDVPGAASDFAQFLCCSGSAQMYGLLNMKTDGQADGLIEDVKRRWEFDEEEPETITVPRPSPPTPPELVPTSNQKEIDARTQSEFPADRADVDENTPFAFEAVEPSERRISDRRPLVVTRQVELNSKIRNAVRADEGQSLHLAMLFETHENRYPVRVEHVRGYKSPGCDVVSFFDQGEAERFKQARQLEPARVARFIELKACSTRGGRVELTQNERAAAERHGSRYYVYRVFQDPASPERNQLAILCDPVNRGAEAISRYSYDFDNKDSGTELFNLIRLPNKASKAETFFEVTLS